MDQQLLDRAREWVNEHRDTDGLSDAEYAAAVREVADDLATIDADDEPYGSDPERLAFTDRDDT